MPLSKEELMAKSEATRLKNLRIRLAQGPPLSPLDKAILKRLEAKLASNNTAGKFVDGSEDFHNSR